MTHDAEARREELRQDAAMDPEDIAREHEDTAQEHEDIDSDPEDTLREPEDIAPEPISLGSIAMGSEEAEYEDTLDEPVVAHAPASPETAAVPPAGLWPEGAVDDLRERWNAIQLRFVDDPPAVASDLRALMSETMDSLQATLVQRRQEIDSSTSSTTDTEELRQLVSRYRSLFESLTA